ncbi:unnamed protein product, partial [Amoebophrya sp. A25]|eukprot:GSA25T00004739001.1
MQPLTDGRWATARIEVLEAAAVGLAAKQLPSWTSNSDLVVLIDNTPVLYNFIKCSGKSAVVANTAVDV